MTLQCGCNQYIINVRNASYAGGKVVTSPCSNCKKTITSADALGLFGGVSLSLRNSFITSGHKLSTPEEAARLFAALEASRAVTSIYLRTPHVTLVQNGVDAKVMEAIAEGLRRNTALVKFSSCTLATRRSGKLDRSGGSEICLRGA